MTAKIKLNAASGGGSFSLQAPSSSANNRVFTLPDIADATMATVNGITMADTYRLSSSFQGDADPITNLERSDDATSGFIGTGMTNSSGIFTFPTTGIFYIYFGAVFFYSGTDREIMIQILASSDSGSNYDVVGIGRTSVFGAGANTQISCQASATVDVTNAGTFRCKGLVQVADNSVYTNADTNSDQTYLRFIRLGDT